MFLFMTLELGIDSYPLLLKLVSKATDRTFYDALSP